MTAKWDVSVRVEIGPKHGDLDETVWEDDAVMRYPDDWSRRQCAADFLRAIADQIEFGSLAVTLRTGCQPEEQA